MAYIVTVHLFYVTNIISAENDPSDVMHISYGTRVVMLGVIQMRLVFKIIPFFDSPTYKMLILLKL